MGSSKLLVLLGSRGLQAADAGHGQGLALQLSLVPTSSVASTLSPSPPNAPCEYSRSPCIVECMGKDRNQRGFCF